MSLFIFILMNFVVAGSSFIISHRLLRTPDFIDRLICWFIIYSAQIIFTEVFLGSFGILYLKNIIVMNSAIFLILWSIYNRGDYSFNLRPVKDILFKAIKNRSILLCACIILGFGLVRIFSGLINPPLGWDSLNYHFTFPVEWLKHGNLQNPVVVSDDPFPTYYPINGSLIFFWLILPFKSAFLADLGQVPFFLISFLAILSIGRKLGLNKEYAFFSAGLFVMIPNFFKQLGIGYVDIMCVGTFLAALNFLLMLKKEFSLKNAALFAISFGIFIGIKTTVLAYGLLILFPFLIMLFLQKEIRFASKIGYATLFFAIVSAFGGFSYFRNLILIGNPFYPLEVTISGKTILKGVIDKATFISRNEEGGYSLSKLLFHEGMGVQVLLIVLPAAILALPANIFKNKDKGLFLNYILFLPLLLYLVFRFILPIPNSRYLYPVLATGMISGFYTLKSLKVPLKIIRIIAVIFIIASAAECSRNMELGISFTLSFLLFMIFILLLRNQRLPAGLFSKAAAASLALVLLITLQFLSADYKKNEYARYIKNSRYWPDATAAWAWLNNNTSGNNIAYVGRPVPYPLYGTGFKNNVYYVSVNYMDPIRLEDISGSKYRWIDAESMHRNFEEPYNYRGNADYYVWMNNLRKRGTDFLFIYSLHHTKDIAFPIEESWAKAHPDIFNLSFNNSTVRVYKLIR